MPAAVNELAPAGVEGPGGGAGVGGARVSWAGRAETRRVPAAVSRLVPGGAGRGRGAITRGGRGRRARRRSRGRRAARARGRGCGARARAARRRRPRAGAPPGMTPADKT